MRVIQTDESVPLFDIPCGRNNSTDDGLQELDRLSYQILCGNAHDVVRSLDVAINAVVTSVPYFKKRRYGDSVFEIGHEESVQQFIHQLADVFDGIPLHPLGSVWVNLGDSRHEGGWLLVPESFAAEMTRRGWILLDKVVWAKMTVDDDGACEGNCLPEPTQKRLNGNSHESFYRFAKSTNAWADTTAVRIPRIENDVPKVVRYLPEELMKSQTSVEGRVLSDVWQISNVGQKSNNHYAVFPPALCERPIGMTCPMFVDRTGNPRSRIVEMVEYDDGHGKRGMGKYQSGSSANNIDVRQASGRNDTGRIYIPRKPVTVDWTPLDAEWRPGIVLDPFAGSGTTAEVGLKMGRSVIAVDLYEDNCRAMEVRCRDTLNYMRTNRLNPFRMFR